MVKARLRGLARLTFGNPLSLAYLGLVAAAALVLAYDQLFVTHEDASFAGVGLIFTAAPTVFGFIAAEEAIWGLEGSGWYFSLGIAASVLFQSFVLGLLLRLLNGRARPAHPQGA
ncbi:hypothetical protein NLX86_11325 [Streptomyces sp. A3M-1-3]|uniref:SCO4225 family membrane protein n=1 Tax=Streptomyces sp. A3M-1-3 TaxID=2962044 RepID=UPI0020B68C1F|nr:hypothetical protein [Streptomyces sp. A3M-1-3]MCP3818686.1 hypothetical protein [Streptomyces sp. A3M-1-3]